MTFLLYVRQTWMTQLILAIFLWGVIFNLKGFYYSCMDGLGVYVKEGLPFARDLPQENSGYSYFYL